MKTSFRSNPDFNQIFNEKGIICVSIILPTHKVFPDRRVDNYNVSKAIEKAKKMLHENYDVYHIEPIIASLNKLFGQIDFDHNDEGLGLFVSETTELLVKFPFPVTEKLIIGSRFEIRDLLITEKFSTPYLVLCFNESGVNLYKGHMYELAEIKDGYFPAKYIDDYEYNYPSKSSFHSGSSVIEQFEKDKSVQQAIHFKNFLHQVDQKLQPYLQDYTNMILMAPKKQLAWFNSISANVDRIISSIHGNFQHESLSEIALLCWKEMKKHLDDLLGAELNLFCEKIGQKQGVFGLDQVWKSTKDGKAWKLLVEKDFMFTAYTDEQQYELHGTPDVSYSNTLPDAVDELIRLVLEKNGDVNFTENDQLKEYDRIAMITRY